MKKLIFACLLTSLAIAETPQKNYRNVIILLDQDWSVENVSKVGFFLSSVLQAAIDEQSCPIILNAGLWNCFVERRLSISQMSEMPSSPEQKALELYTNINDRLNYWAQFYKEKNIDRMQARQLMLAKVSDEFYTKTFESDDQTTHHINPGTLNSSLMAYLTNFDKNDWEFYTNGKSFYLLVPKKYLKELEDETSQSTKNKNFSKKELLLGLKVDHLTRFHDVEDPVAGYFDTTCLDQLFPHHLEDFFITTNDLKAKESEYLWGIVFYGHGGHLYKEITTNTVNAHVDPIIGDLPPKDFHDVLEFCDKQIGTHYFYYSTCSGAGNHIKMVFDDFGNPTYRYPIICGCLSDGFAHCLWPNTPFPKPGKSPLKPSQICYENGKWQLYYDHLYQWKNFFKNMTHHSFESYDLKWLADVLQKITFRTLCDNPLIRFAYSSKFVPVLPDNTTIINDELIALKKDEQSTTIIINESNILVASAHVPFHLIIKNPARIASICAGHAKHYFEKIEFKSNTSFLDTFSPLEGNYQYEKHYIIDEMIIPNDKNSPIAKKIGLTNEKIVAKNVLVHTQRDTLIRIFAQIDDGFYMLTINRTDYLSGAPELKGISKMTKAVADTYLKRYEKLKSAIT